MDARSPHALVGLCDNIISRIEYVTRGLNLLRERSKTVSITMEMAIDQITALQSESRRLSAWMEKPSSALSEDERSALETSLIVCENLVLNLHRHITGVKEDSERFSFRAKSRFPWNESTLREYTELLHCQVKALGFHLQMLLLYAPHPL